MESDKIHLRQQIDANFALRGFEAAAAFCGVAFTIFAARMEFPFVVVASAGVATIVPFLDALRRTISNVRNTRVLTKHMQLPHYE